ncbi:MAG: ATP-dependent zinc metalloprotease FtsH [Patescibacteria group bacterium]
MKPLSKSVIFFLLGVLLLGVLFSNSAIRPSTTESVALSSLIQKIQNHEITSIDILEDKITATGTDGKIFVTSKEAGQTFTEVLEGSGVTAETVKDISVTVSQPSQTTEFIRNILPTAIVVVILSVILWFFLKQMQGANNRAMTFGQSNAREVTNKKNRVAFADVAGNPEAKEELAEVVEFLKTPKKFSDLGAKIPKGVLLMGPPGTGKTLMARAVAGEANVPFFHISGSEFVEMFVGVGASRVRDLFAKAKKAAPCIVFIDEIDAVGRQRGAGLGGGHDEREQTLNQILVEMDGFDPNLGVIVIAATNRPDVLDSALLRPGRFDRRVILDRPDLKDREAILKIHSENKPLAPDVDLHRIAERTTGLSGADLMNVMNEAAIFAARRDQKTIAQKDLLDSIEKVLIGPERKSHILSEAERAVTAYHESGHAIIGHMLPYCDDVHKVSIISRGRAAGYTMSIPDEEKKMHSRKEFVDELAMILGGYVAETEIFGDLTTGASNDLQRATQLAIELVTQYGMSDALGPRTYGEHEEMIFLGKQIHENRNYSEKTAERIDEEINILLNNAKETARAIIRKERPRIDAIVKHLLEKETIEKEEFIALVGPAIKAEVSKALPVNL